MNKIKSNFKKVLSYIAARRILRNSIIKTTRKRIGSIGEIKRLRGLLKKAEELEMTLILYSPYSDEPKVFRNLAAAINAFQKIKALEILER